MTQFTQRISRGLEAVLIWLLGALALFTAFELGAWLLAGRSFPQLEEIQGLLMIWFALLAAAYCLSLRLHLSLELVVRRLPSSWQAHSGRLAALLVAVFGALLGFHAVRLVAAVDNVLPATGWKASLQYVPAVVAGALILLFALEQAFYYRGEGDRE